ERDHGLRAGRRGRPACSIAGASRRCVAAAAGDADRHSLAELLGSDPAGVRPQPLNQRRLPPSSWCARKKFSEPAVAIAALAEISSARVAAATTCANRYTLPAPAQPISSSHAWAYGN